MVAVNSFSLASENISPNAGTFVTVLGVLDCALLCLNTKNCVSFYYSENMRSCALSSAANKNPNGFIDKAGIKYYTKRKGFGMQCVLSTDCSFENFICNQGSCQCVIGYIYQPSNERCVMREVISSSEVSLIDVAKNKLVMSSSRFNPLSGPEKAVDGNRNTDFNKWGCTATKEEDASPWWQIDLGQEFLVHKVTILNKQDAASLHNLSIGVYLLNPIKYRGAERQPCFKYADNFTGLELEIKCTRPVIGQFLRIEKTKNSPSDTLQMCEVGVFVKEVTEIT